MEHYEPGGGQDKGQDRAAEVWGTTGEYPEMGNFRGRSRVRRGSPQKNTGQTAEMPPIGKPPKDKQKGSAARNGLVIFLLLLVLALLSVIFCFLWIIMSPAETVAPIESQKEVQVVEPGEEELEARGWVPSDRIKKYAEEFNINSEFLSRLFPTKVIYKDGGKIFYANINPDLKKHLYDWRSLVWSNKRPAYASTSGAAALLGIDVSKYQSDVDWSKVAADGISFAMIRMGYRGYGSGAIVMDEYFENNIKGAADAGVQVGIYFFSQAITEAEGAEEADAVLAAISGHNVTFPIVFDMEEIAGSTARVDGLDAQQVTAIAAAFCERVKAAGYKPMIYANPKWFVAKMDMEKLEDYDKWLAQYYTTPAFPYNFTIWQYSDSGTVSGIKGNVDMNLAFVDYAQSQR